MGLLYKIKDTFTTSYAEEKRNEYKSIYNKLDNKIEAIDEELSELKSAIEELHGYYTKNPSSVRGKISTTYVNKENEFYAGCNELYGILCSALSDLKTKKEEAYSEWQYWEEECNKEDEEEEERNYD